MTSMRGQLFCACSIVFLCALVARGVSGDEGAITTLRFENSLGTSETASTRPIDTQNAFVQSLGTNDRACISCHQPKDGWTVSASSVRKRFNDSDGFDPIFRVNDGATCPTAD